MGFKGGRFSHASLNEGVRVTKWMAIITMIMIYVKSTCGLCESRFSFYGVEMICDCSFFYILVTPQLFYEIFAICSVLKKLKPFCDSPTQYSGQKVANFCSKK